MLLNPSLRLNILGFKFDLILSLASGLTLNPTDLVKNPLFLRGDSALNSNEVLGLGDLLNGDVILRSFTIVFLSSRMFRFKG